ncbi:MAG TPA: hypothetical protein VFT98_13995 [Myxococcota bacterium]|nr:hypothetical protein [Myxococcota bacterium]
MRRSCDGRRALALGLALSGAIACGDDGAGDSAANAAASATEGAIASSARESGGAASGASDGAKRTAPAPAPIDGRTGELVNPESSAMVLLYYDMAGIAPPIERWVEADSRVAYVKPIEKPAAREMVRAELEAAAAAVRNVGVLRLSLAANLSEYDPSYGEFTLRALAPSSVVTFDAFQQKVELRFGNGLEAQTWKVAPEDSQLIRDTLGPIGSATADVLLVITGVQPAPGGGSFTADVVEYELREDRSGNLLARVRVAS